MPRGYIQTENSSPIEIVDVWAREQIENIEPTAMAKIFEFTIEEPVAQIELPWDNKYTEVLFISKGICNSSTQQAAVWFDIDNKTVITNVLLCASSTQTLYGWTYARWNGYGWVYQVSSGAISDTNYTSATSNGSFPYNLRKSERGSTATIRFNTTPQYMPISGSFEVWAR